MKIVLIIGLAVIQLFAGIKGEFNREYYSFQVIMCTTNGTIIAKISQKLFEKKNIFAKVYYV